MFLGGFVMLAFTFFAGVLTSVYEYPVLMLLFFGYVIFASVVLAYWDSLDMLTLLEKNVKADGLYPW